MIWWEILNCEGPNIRTELTAVFKSQNSGKLRVIKLVESF